MSVAEELPETLAGETGIGIRRLGDAAGAATPIRLRRSGAVEGGDDGCVTETLERSEAERESKRELRASRISRPVGRPQISDEAWAIMVTRAREKLETKLGRPLSEISLDRRRRQFDSARYDDLCGRVFQAVTDGATLRVVAEALGGVSPSTVTDLARRGREVLREGCEKHGTLRLDCPHCLRRRLRRFGDFDQLDVAALGRDVFVHLWPKLVQRDGQWVVIDEDGRILERLGHVDHAAGRLEELG